MLVSSFDQTASRISATGGDSIFAELRDALAGPVVAFADQDAVAVRREVLHHTGLDDLVGGEDHSADDPFPRDAGAQAPAGIEEGEVRRRGVPRRQPDIVPPGNAILRHHDSRVLAQQGF
jgi:hypothetical protein